MTGEFSMLAVRDPWWVMVILFPESQLNYDPARYKIFVTVLPIGTSSEALFLFNSGMGSFLR
jgi:hypothetical protein